MAQMGKLRLSWVTQLLESRGYEHTQPDTSVCVLGLRAGAVHLQSTLKPLRAKGRPLGAGCWVQAGLTSQEGKSSRRGLGDRQAPGARGCLALGELRLPWSPQRGAKEGRALQEPMPGCAQMPSRAPGLCLLER